MDISTRIQNLTGERPDRISALSGGCVGDVFCITMPSGPDLVVKVGDTGSGPESGLNCEGFMLRYLARQSQLPVPEVIHADDTLLVMHKIESGGGLGAAVQRDAAVHLVALHDLTTDRGYGFERDTVIGGLAQPNPWTPRWLDFFRDQRLVHMGREAERMGRLPSATLTRLMRFVEHLARWIKEPAQPSLIHGDMWSGNVLSANERITGFIDPAIYFADAEIELAFSTLFNTFGAAFFDRYTELHPIKPGFFEQRCEIYNLYPLLVHVCLFGGSYVASVERTLKKFGF